MLEQRDAARAAPQTRPRPRLERRLLLRRRGLHARGARAAARRRTHASEIIGTDIDRRMVERARAGRFSDDDARTRRRSSCSSSAGSTSVDGDGWQAKQSAAGALDALRGRRPAAACAERRGLRPRPLPQHRHLLHRSRSATRCTRGSPTSLRPGGYLVIGSTERVSQSARASASSPPIPSPTGRAGPLMDTSEYLPMFLAEAREHLQELNLAVVGSRRHPTTARRSTSIFRIAHSLKGMSATMGFAAIAALTHAMEDVFELLAPAHRRSRRARRSTCCSRASTRSRPRSSRSQPTAQREARPGAAHRAAAGPDPRPHAGAGAGPRPAASSCPTCPPLARRAPRAPASCTSSPSSPTTR